MTTSRRFGPFFVPTDGSAGDWITNATSQGRTVAGLVPAEFDAYARVFHPAYRPVEGNEEFEPTAPNYVSGLAPAGETRVTYLREVRWSEVAAANGRSAHPAMEWTSITGSCRFRRHGEQPGLWTIPPEIGYMPWRVASVVSRVLGAHTGTPDLCWFGSWLGYGDLPASLRLAPLVAGTRVVGGSIGKLPEVSFNDSADEPALPKADFRSPNLWWPHDRAWCVVSNVDLQSTFIGGARHCIQDLLLHADIEIMPIDLAQGIALDTDTINPVPADCPDS
jgi:hypothetical protein